MIRRFNRYELKYVIHVDKARRIMDDLATMTEPDPYGENGYPLVSLYYDSPAMDCYWAKIEGLKFRRKLRVRIYPATPIRSTTHGMVEIKQRMNRTVQKRRLRLTLEEAEQLCRGDLRRDDLEPMDQQVAAEVQYMVHAMHLRPTCITAYHRKAFVGGLYDAGLRITFDTNVSYRVHALTVQEDATNHLIISPQWSIMEVKANETIPDWVTSLLARHGCSLTRVSKYCAGMAMANRHAVIPYAIAPVRGLEVRTHG